MKKNISGWGLWPQVEAEIYRPSTRDQAQSQIEDLTTFIPRGLGRSYGDSSLWHQALSSLKMNRFLSFDAKKGVLQCEAGVRLREILEVFVPRGWFLPVTPGTKYITVGGAIASDVHGKNHHLEGTFCDHLLEMEVLLPQGGIVTCGPGKKEELFRAICGGMGLVGVILRATFSLRPIDSYLIRQKTLKAAHLDEAMELFEEHREWTYSVAWIDCLARKSKLGRSLLMVGEHVTREENWEYELAARPLNLPKQKKVSIPFSFPNFALNKYSIRAFNFLYYHRQRKKEKEDFVDYDSFFYPLDSILHWNRIYGKRGFTQYQCVLPKESSREGLGEILERVSQQGRGSFLAVLKLFGPENKNYLSFPREGYTLALDFPLSKALYPFLEELDQMVLDYGGRIYLSKDVRMAEKTFKESYPQLEDFLKVKEEVDWNRQLQSLQSRRLGI